MHPIKLQTAQRPMQETRMELVIIHSSLWLIQQPQTCLQGVKLRFVQDTVLGSQMSHDLPDGVRSMGHHEICVALRMRDEKSSPVMDV